jgi:hypothetical protein
MDAMPCRTGRVFGKGTEVLRVSCAMGMRACQQLGGKETCTDARVDEVVFCRANGSLSGVGAVLVGRNMLKLNVLGDEEKRQGVGWRFRCPILS